MKGKPRKSHNDSIVSCRTRKDPFADVRDEIHEQLEKNPDLSVKALFKAFQQKISVEV
jgi:hypothetical protein